MFIWVQVLRGIAALMVVCHHYIGAQIERGMVIDEWLVAFGASGTDIFFVISGFIMMYTQSVAKRSFEFSQFMLKRLIRIAPVYWILTTFAFAISIFGLTHAKFGIANYVYSMLFLPYSSSHLSMASSAYQAYVIPMSWTLTFEWYFYLVFALAMSLLVNIRYKISLIFIIFLMSISAGHFLQPQPLLLQIMTSPLLMEFLLGTIVAALYLNEVRFNKFLLLIIAIVSMGVLSNILHDSIYSRILIWGTSSFLLVCSATLFIQKKDIAAWIKPLAWLGDVSYSLYLSHFFTVAIFVRLQGKMALLQDGLSVATIALFLSINFVVAWLCYIGIENPSRHYLTKWMPVDKS